MDVRVTPDLAGIDRVVEGRLAVSEVETAVAALRRGELVVLPTDTVYGLACSAGSESRRPTSTGSRAETRSSRRP